MKENQSLHDKFLVQMRYRAPVALWQERYISHKDNARDAFKLFLGGAIVLCIAFVLVATIFGGAIADAFVPTGCTSDKPELCAGLSPKGFLYSSATLLVTSIALWLLRLQMRVYLSERHLSLDAQEKKAFAEAYLAIREDKAAAAEHEAIILQSLFRPTQDGIIRDDSSFDASPASIFSKLLSQNGSR